MLEQRVFCDTAERAAARARRCSAVRLLTPHTHHPQQQTNKHQTDQLGRDRGAQGVKQQLLIRLMMTPFLPV